MATVIGRRQFISALGGTAVAWPLAARAQQSSMPLVGLLLIGSPGPNWTPAMAAFYRGLNETGYVEGRNVAIETRWVGLQFDQVPATVDDLVRRQVAVIFASGAPVAMAAKTHTATVPIVFFIGEDPIREGLVASLNRPGGNITGTTNFQNQLFGKQLGLLRDVLSKTTEFGFLIDQNNPNAAPDTKDARAAADALGQDLRVLTASNESELERAFAAMGPLRVGGLLVSTATFGVTAEKLVAITARYAVPAMYQTREYPVIGGLISYGADRAVAWHEIGVYVGRILKGEKPADLPVVQSSKFDFVLNLRTAKVLGLEIPPTVLALADEVIE
jgi:putative ABC transport system substrate-binding protein